MKKSTDLSIINNSFDISNPVHESSPIPVHTSTPLVNNKSLKRAHLIKEQSSRSFSSPVSKNSRTSDLIDESLVDIVFDSGDKENVNVRKILSCEETETETTSVVGESSMSEAGPANPTKRVESSISIEEHSNEISNAYEELEIVEDSGDGEKIGENTIAEMINSASGSAPKKPTATNNWKQKEDGNKGRKGPIRRIVYYSSDDEEDEEEEKESVIIGEKIEVLGTDDQTDEDSLDSESESKIKDSTGTATSSHKSAQSAPSSSSGPLFVSPHQMKPQILAPQPGRLYGGKMTTDRLEKIHGISKDIITVMHKSLSTMPENVPTESPKGLSIDLMVHQKHGLTWLLWRELQVPPGGILADDMGLGKTLSMISLILHKKIARKQNAEEMDNIDRILRREYIMDKQLIASNATLVVAPASLIFQWEKEVRDRVKDNRLNVHVFHGPKNKRDIAASRLAKFDIVITTYEMLASELKTPKYGLIGQSDDSSDISDVIVGKKGKAKPKLPKFSSSVLAKIAWDRIILDEAHEIRNKNSLKSSSCCRLEAVHRWCLTGTPIHNKLWDLYALIRFLRVTPFSEEKMWKEFIMTSSTKSAERLNTIIKSILLRRAKNQICIETNRPIVDLQPKKMELVNLELQKIEKHCYSIMFEASKQKVQALLHEAEMNKHGYSIRNRRAKAGDKIPIINPFREIGGAARIGAVDNFKMFSYILVILLRLRQACVHMYLTKKAIDVEAFKEDGIDDQGGGPGELAEKVLEMSMAQMSLDEDGLGMSSQIDQIFERDFASTKVVAVLERLDKIVEAGDKCVIVSQWTEMLAIVEINLKRKRVTFTSITGDIKTEDRQARVDNFNKPNSGPMVMLLSLTAGGVGLNLIGGNHLFLVDLHWNPALEQQACDRIYRLGQKKNVFIHKFICQETIEQRVLNLQEKKIALATSVLEGAASKKMNKLTREELAFLFELDKRPTQKQGAKGTTGTDSQGTQQSQMNGLPPTQNAEQELAKFGGGFP